MSPTSTNGHIMVQSHSCVLVPKVRVHFACAYLIAWRGSEVEHAHGLGDVLHLGLGLRQLLGQLLRDPLGTA